MFVEQVVRTHCDAELLVHIDSEGEVEQVVGADPFDDKVSERLIITDRARVAPANAGGKRTVDPRQPALPYPARLRVPAVQTEAASAFDRYRPVIAEHGEARLVQPGSSQLPGQAH